MTTTFPDEIVYSSIMHSNLPRHEKSTIGKWLNKVTGGRTGKLARSIGMEHVESGVGAIRQTGESILTGGILGALHASLKTGLDVDKVPVDGIIAAITIPAGVALAHSHMGQDLKNVGATAAGIFTFRKVNAFVAEKRRASGKTVFSGEDDDPIVQAAKNL